MAVAQKKPSAAPLKDLYDIGEIPAARSRAGEHARLGDPQGAPRSAGDVDAAGGAADLADRG